MLAVSANEVRVLHPEQTLVLQRAHIPTRLLYVCLPDAVSGVLLVALVEFKVPDVLRVVHCSD